MAGTGYRTGEPAVRAVGAGPHSRNAAMRWTLDHVADRWLVPGAARWRQRGSWRAAPCGKASPVARWAAADMRGAAQSISKSIIEPSFRWSEVDRGVVVMMTTPLVLEYATVVPPTSSPAADLPDARIPSRSTHCCSATWFTGPPSPPVLGNLGGAQSHDQPIRARKT